MDDKELLVQIKRCIEKSREQADPKRDKLFLVLLGKSDRRIDRRFEKSENKKEGDFNGL